MFGSTSPLPVPNFLTIISVFTGLILINILPILASPDYSSFAKSDISNSSAVTSKINDNNSKIGTDIPNAKSVYDSQTMVLPSFLVRSFVMFIVDEAHEPPESSQKHVSDHNSYFIPMNLTIPQGVSLSFLDADAPWDTPHPHTIVVIDKGSEKIVFNTGKLDYTNSSKPLVLPAGEYVISDTKYPWMRGSLFVSPNQKVSSSANLVVGGFYTPTNKVLNNKDNEGVAHPGWLGYYRTALPMNAFQILSEYSFHYAKCKYCPGGFWPDLKSSNHTLIVYSTHQPLLQALSKLAKMVWDNTYN